MTDTPFTAVRKLPTREAAAVLGVSESFLNKLRIQGGGPPFLKLGRRVLYDPRDLEEWAHARRHRNTSEGRADAPIGLSRRHPRGARERQRGDTIMTDLRETDVGTDLNDSFDDDILDERCDSGVGVEEAEPTTIVSLQLLAEALLPKAGSLA